MPKGANITFDDTNFQRALRRYIKRAKNLTPIMKGIGIQASKEIESNFPKQRDSKSQSWKPLKKATLAARKKAKKGNKFGPKILMDTGLLRTINFRVKQKSVLVGTSANYGEPHQFGAPKKHIPKREWLFIDKDGKSKLVKVLKVFFKKGFR